MADIELVIKIPEEKHQTIINHTEEILDESSFIEPKYLYRAVLNGIPLPKGHGKLIAEPTEEDIAKTILGQNDFADCIRDSVKAVFDNAAAIIEADKAER